MEKIITQLPIDSYKILKVIKNSLGYIDPRLMEHGKRVAYIAKEISSISDKYSLLDRETLLILSFLHDVGAYKTEEIDDMMRFESKNVLSHSIYGYLFLKNTTDLGEIAQAILYHHSSYSYLKKINMQYIDYAQIISFSDRVDILIQSDKNTDFKAFEKFLDEKYDRQLYNDFSTVKEKIKSNIISDAYSEDMNNYVKETYISDDKAISYLKMIVYAIDFRSTFTVTHSVNTTSIAVKIAQLLNLPQSEIDKIYVAAFLHDIGKIAVPYEILEKPGRLEKNELDLIRNHVVKTKEIIKGLVDEEICNIASRHHEKLNGRGYPEGLGENDLTVSERIVSISDIISALTGKRSYKEAYSKERTIELLNLMLKNNEIDKNITNIAIDNFDEIMSFMNKNNDPVIGLFDEMKKQYEYLSTHVE